MLQTVLLDRKDSRGRNLWELKEPYRYALGVNTIVEVPVGYITNFGTIPRWAYWFITPDEMREASVLHDFLTNESFTLDGEPTYSGFSRAVADAILYVHLRKIGIDVVRSTAVYVGVRLWALSTGQFS
jgi:hypothetical protein